MPQCECGCMEQTASGSFRPGHDQKLRTMLEHRVGGLLALKSLVESAEELATGNLSPEAHADQVLAILNAARE